MNRGSAIALIALALVVAASILLSFRLTDLDAFDVVADHEIIVSEAVAEASETQQDRVTVAIGELQASDDLIDLTVRVCSDDVELSPSMDIVLESRPGSSELTASWRAESIVIEDTEETDFAENAVYLPDDCIGFHRRDVEVGGELMLSWPAALFDDSLPSAELQVNRTSRAPLGKPDRGIVGLFFIAALVLLLAGQVTARAGENKWTGWQAMGVMGAFLVATIALSPLGFGGPISLFVMMLASTGAYLFTALSIAWSHNPRSPLSALAFHGIPARKVAASVGFGVAAALLAVFLLSWAPRGESEMTRILEPSTGLLRVAALALIAPWAEEFLLRGVLYGALERKAGPIGAIIGSASVFSLLHLAQHLGSLGPWLVVTLTGLILSMVRWYTGSTVGSTISHLVYNAVLIAPALALG